MVCKSWQSAARRIKLSLRQNDIYLTLITQKSSLQFFGWFESHLSFQLKRMSAKFIFTCLGEAAYSMNSLLFSMHHFS
jgi:hypothetical protein